MNIVKVLKKTGKTFMSCRCPHCDSEEGGFLESYLHVYKGKDFLCENCYKHYRISKEVSVED